MVSSTIIAIVTALAAILGAISPIIVVLIQSRKDKPQPVKGLYLPEKVVLHHPNRQIRWYIVLVFALFGGILGYGGARLAATPTSSNTPVVSTLPSPSFTPTYDEILTEAKKWPVEMSDSFDGNRNGWSIGTSKSDELTTSQTINGKYVWIIKAKSQWLLIESPAKVQQEMNFYLSIDCKRVSGNNSPCGFVFRDNNKGRYLFRIRDLTQQYLFFATYKPEGRKDFLNSDDWPKSPIIKPGDKNTLEVIVLGDRYIFYINDQFLDEFKDDSITSAGLPGIFVAIDPGDEAVYEFDNFELRTAPNN
jgi:hypothetical protein